MYCAIVLTHAVICCLGTQVLARLQTVYVVLNVMYVSLFSSFIPFRFWFRLPWLFCSFAFRAFSSTFDLSLGLSTVPSSPSFASSASVLAPSYSPPEVGFNSSLYSICHLFRLRPLHSVFPSFLSSLHFYILFALSPSSFRLPIFFILPLLSCRLWLWKCFVVVLGL